MGAPTSWPQRPPEPLPLLCQECGKPQVNTGGYEFPRFRCIARDCRVSVFKPVKVPTFAEMGWI